MKQADKQTETMPDLAKIEQKVRTAQALEKIGQAIPKRFGRGKGLLGPEHYGCCGTGMRPAIMRSPYREVPGLFFVGPELLIDKFKMTAAMDSVNDNLRRFYSEDRKGPAYHRVYVYRTRKPAVTKFLADCERIIDWNLQQAADNHRAIEAANRGDMAGALALA